MNKRYKQLKPLKYFGAAGQEFDLAPGGTIPLTNEELKVFVFDDFFEPLEPTRWRALSGGRYWSLDITLEPTVSPDFDSETDNELYELGNFFRTKESAQAAAEAIKGLLAWTHKPYSDTDHDEYIKLVKVINAARAAVSEGTE